MKKSAVDMSLVAMGKKLSVISFAVCTILGIMFVLIGIPLLMCGTSTTKVNAMIHAKNTVEPAKCDDQRPMVCLSLVYTYNSKDYVTKKTVQDKPELEVGKVVQIHIKKKNPTDISMDSNCSLLTIIFGILSILLGLVLIWLGILKIVYNMRDQKVAQATGRNHLHTWV